jgi:hypothetical protein
MVEQPIVQGKVGPMKQNGCASTFTNSRKRMATCFDKRVACIV